MNIKIILIVGIGGFIGAVLRLLISSFFQHRVQSDFPSATLIINIVGSFLIGLFFAWHAKESIHDHWRFFVVTGILGGFTTFSAFSWENISLIQQARYGTAFLYTFLSIVLSLLACILGFNFQFMFRHIVIPMG